MNSPTESRLTPSRSRAMTCGDEATAAVPESELRLAPEERVSVRDALDMLALALTDTGHVWTDRERSAYEGAIGIVG